VRGEIITKKLMQAKGKTPRFFRHPYLHTGLSLPVKEGLNKFLFDTGYTIAPVTMDNDDYIFSRAYDLAFDKNDKRLMREIGAAYVPYLESKADYWERQSVKLFNREINKFCFSTRILSTPIISTMWLKCSKSAAINLSLWKKR